MGKALHLIISTAAAVSLLATGCRQHPSDATPTAIDTTAVMVMQVQKCSRLYAAEMQVHKIVTHDDVMRLRGRMMGTNHTLNLPLSDRKVAIPMDATLKAYIDFGTFSAQQVERRNGKVTIILPDPRILLTQTKIDQQGIKEHVGLLRSGFSDEELAAYEQQGRQSIIDNVPQTGLIEMARDNAARMLIPMIEQMGFRREDITITFRHDLNTGDMGSLIDGSQQGGR